MDNSRIPQPPAAPSFWSVRRFDSGIPSHMTEQLEITFGGPLHIVVEQPQPPTVTAQLTITFNSFKVKGEHLMVYALAADHFVMMEVSYVDAANNPAEIDGQVAWAISDETLATLDVDQADSSIVKVTPAGPIGQVQVTATADVKLGPEVKNLVTPCDIEIVAGEAVAGTIQPIGDQQPIS